MDFTSVNILAVIVGMVVAMIIGSVWYGPLFGKQWMASMGITQAMKQDAMKKGMGKTWALAFVNALVMSYALNLIINILGAFTWQLGAVSALTLAVGFQATTVYSGVLWEGKKMNMFAINAGYYLVTMAILGAIFAVWK